jgi:queuine tRNA-ribosyltransferase
MRSFDYTRTPPEPPLGVVLVVAFFVVVIIARNLCASAGTASTQNSGMAWLDMAVLLRNKRPMTVPNHFELLATEGAARTGRLTTPHGVVQTPAFMPVGSAGAMKGLHWREVREAGSDIVLGNTYHLMLRPGAERIAALGGLQRFTGWNGPMLTDSGGFQVMSLSALRKVDDNAVTFRSHIDGAKVELSPERAIEVQRLLNSDIAMQLDECVRLPAERADIERAMQLSLRWAERSRRAFEVAPAGYMLFGIVQGGDVVELRQMSARALVDIGFHGYAIGGLAVGEPQKVMLATVEQVTPLLPADRSRYLMGVGTPEDLLESVRRGIDMFDCVLPTRNGRHGLAFTRFGPVNLRNARHADDPRPLDETSAWPSTRDVSRAYLHHLVKAGETLGAMLLSEINIAYYQRLMADIRDAISRGTFAELCEQTRAEWAQGDIAPR